MGLKNKEQYKLTNHFIKRFTERFHIPYDSQFNKFLNNMLDSVTLVMEKKNFHYYKNDEYFLIVDTDKKKLVTVYSKNEKEDVPSEIDTTVPIVTEELKNGLTNLLDKYATDFLKTKAKEVKGYISIVNKLPMNSREDIVNLCEEIKLLEDVLLQTVRTFDAIRKHELV